jgi:hypothetical protein
VHGSVPLFEATYRQQRQDYSGQHLVAGAHDVVIDARVGEGRQHVHLSRGLGDHQALGCAINAHARAVIPAVHSVSLAFGTAGCGVSFVSQVAGNRQIFVEAAAKAAKLKCEKCCDAQIFDKQHEQCLPSIFQLSQAVQQRVEGGAARLWSSVGIQAEDAAHPGSGVLHLRK